MWLCVTVTGTDISDCENPSGLGIEQGMVEYVYPFWNSLSTLRHTKGNNRWVDSPTSAINKRAFDPWRNKIIDSIQMEFGLVFEVVLVLVRNARGSRLALFDLYCDTPGKPIFLVRSCTNTELIITNFFKPPDSTENPSSQETLERSHHRHSGYVSIRRKLQEVRILQRSI